MSEPRKKLDKSSLALILLALIGVGIGIWLLQDMTDSGDRGTGDKIAKVRIYKNDARVKRSSKFEWYNFKNELDFYEDDRVFTGNDSYAEIEFTSGAKIKILPNSLITLTRGQVSLNSGTIEVDSTKGKVDIESFGKKFSPPPSSRIRLENKENSQKIIPLEKTAAKFIEERPELNEVQAVEASLVINQPAFEAQIVKSGSITFSWTLTPQNLEAEFRLDFSLQSDFQNLAFTQNLKGNSLSLSAATLPAGTIYWKVTELSKNKSAQSSFSLNDISPIRLIKPIAMDYLLEEAKTTGLVFEWTNEPNYKQRIQISQSAVFEQNIIDEEVAETTAKYNFEKEGQYFWRVGYVIPDSPIAWSAPSKFKLIVPVKAAPKKLALTVPPVMDFSVNESYELSVEPIEECQTYRFDVFRARKAILSQTVGETRLKLKEIPAGEYRAKATCFVDNKVFRESAVLGFRVKGSPPPETPKLKETKSQIFVKIIHTIIDFIIPSASAAENYFTFEWEYVEGADKYDIEISDGDKRVVASNVTTETSYRFLVPGPGIYFWRVRAGRYDIYGEFSEYAELEVLDRIQRVDRPLMISPEDGEIIYSEDGKTVVEFKWDEPEEDFTYEIQIYENKESNPIMTVPVTGESQTLELPPNSFYWRLGATSQYNNGLTNQDKNFVRVETDVPARYDLGISLAQAQTDFTQKAITGGDLTLPSSVNFSGPVISINGEYFFKKSKRSLAASFDRGQLSGDENKLTDTQFTIEYGAWRMAEHSIYFGYLYKSLDLEFDGTDASYRLNFISGRYTYLKQLKDKHYFQLNGSFYLFMPPNTFDPSFSLRPSYKYMVKKSLWAEGFVEWQRLAAEGEVKLPGGTQDVSLTTQTLKFGLGVTWLPTVKE